MSFLELTTLRPAPAVSTRSSRLLFRTPLWLTLKCPRVLDSRPFSIYITLISTFLPLATILCHFRLLSSSIRFHTSPPIGDVVAVAHTSLCSLRLTNAGSLDLSSLLPSHSIPTLLTIFMLVGGKICFSYMRSVFRELPPTTVAAAQQ